MKLRYALEAAEELEQAIDWLNEQRPGLGGELLDQVVAVLDRISDDPLRFERTKGPAGRKPRRARVDRFAYDIIFEPHPSAILIVAVAHHSRRPGYWRKRLA